MTYEDLVEIAAKIAGNYNELQWASMLEKNREGWRKRARAILAALYAEMVKWPETMVDKWPMGGTFREMLAASPLAPPKEPPR
jgi:hypothetical protein